jgi:hypothetical protein
MAALLAALRAPAARAILRALLAVFLREPLGDWAREAHLRAQVRRGAQRAVSPAALG